MPVTLRQLRYFDAVVKQGSFARAAESVFISQPALSFQVRELETILGLTLFERDHHGVALTAAGRKIHTQILRVLDETLLLETMGKRFKEARFNIFLGIVSTLSTYIIPGLHEQVQKAEKRLDLTITEGNSEKLLAKLLAGHLDAAILSLPVGMLELTERKLFEDQFVLAGNTTRLASYRNQADGLAVENLSKSDIGPLLALSEGHCLGDQVLGACSMRTSEAVRRSMESLASVARLASMGVGLTLIPETAVAAERAASPELHFLRLAEPAPRRDIGLVYRVAFNDQDWIEPIAKATESVGQSLIEQSGSLID